MIPKGTKVRIDGVGNESVTGELLNDVSLGNGFALRVIEPDVSIAPVHLTFKRVVSLGQWGAGWNFTTGNGSTYFMFVLKDIQK